MQQLPMRRLALALCAAAGLGAIKEAGGRTLAESEESCVIYGMPKAAVEAGVVQLSVHLLRVADEIVAAV